jgi:putative RNA 2'-phosphotransferase
VLVVGSVDSVKLSRRLSYLLRHRPDAAGLVLDEAGWAPVSDVLRALGIDRARLEELVARSDKQRFALAGDRIRANQGHSIPVELGLEPVAPPERLYHGTPVRNLESIRRQGLVKRGRTHVHLSRDVETAQQVGARRGDSVVLTVRAGAMAAVGHEFFLAANGVWLIDSVPPSYLDELGTGGPSSSR